MSSETNQLHSVELCAGLGIKVDHQATDVVNNMMADADYLQLVRSLNNEQRRFVYHLL